MKMVMAVMVMVRVMVMMMMMITMMVMTMSRICEAVHCSKSHHFIAPPVSYHYAGR